MVDINVRPRPKALWVLASDRRWRIRDIQGSTAESILIQEIRKLVMSGSETGTVYRVDGTLAEPGRHYGGVTKVSRRLSGKSSYILVFIKWQVYSLCYELISGTECQGMITI